MCIRDRTEVKLLGVRVQGTEAPPEIAGALRYANRYKVADLIITGRGGGSIEDLWAFNDERVARAIYESEIPVISAVGHEPDVTIADYVADARASTPSNAAEIAVPDRNDVRARLTALGRSMTKTEESRLSALRERLTALERKRVLRDPDVYKRQFSVCCARSGRRSRGSWRSTSTVSPPTARHWRSNTAT